MLEHPMRISGRWNGEDIVEEIVGKTIAAVDTTSDDLAIRFMDGTFIYVGPVCDCSEESPYLDWEAEPGADALRAIGVLSDAECEEILKAEAERQREAERQERRRQFERLKAEFEPEAPHRG